LLSSKQHVRVWSLMRLLLDECVPARLKRALPNHDVLTVVSQGWSGVKNGQLLALASQSFDAFVTVDKNLPYQQDQTNLPLPVLVLDAVSNELDALLPLMPALEAALADLKPGSFALLRANALQDKPAGG
jgi:predicted nuclease of predicted toxin-antitoxin system